MTSRLSSSCRSAAFVNLSGRSAIGRSSGPIPVEARRKFRLRASSIGQIRWAEGMAFMARASFVDTPTTGFTHCQSQAFDGAHPDPKTGKRTGTYRAGRRIHAFGVTPAMVNSRSSRKQDLCMVSSRPDRVRRTRPLPSRRADPTLFVAHSRARVSMVIQRIS